MPESSSPTPNTWMLVNLSAPAEFRQTIVVNPLPFRIGRRNTNSLCVPHNTVSKEHCELRSARAALTAVDLGSTNGTYVNGRRLSEPALLKRDDLLQLGDVGFRVEVRANDLNEVTNFQLSTAEQGLSTHLFLANIVRGEGIVPFFQPIVRLDDLEMTVGFEVLVRSQLQGLQRPAELFGTAERLDWATRLSEMCRTEGGRAAQALPGAPTLYLNTHPKEICSPELIASLHALREEHPTMPMLLEVHEDALADVSVMRRLRDELNRLDIQLGYDDFGSGTARLHELAEVPPDVLKFDQKLIQGIDKASPHRQAMVRRLVSLVNDLGITSLAEGVETAEEAGFCRQAGFAFAQGFFFGKPASIEQLQAASRTDALQEAGR